MPESVCRYTPTTRSWTTTDPSAVESEKGPEHKAAYARVQRLLKKIGFRRFSSDLYWMPTGGTSARRNVSRLLDAVDAAGPVTVNLDEAKYDWV